MPAEAKYELLSTGPSNVNLTSAKTTSIGLLLPQTGFRQLMFFICLLCAVIYIPLLYSFVSFHQVPNFQWNVNATRDVAVYVQPENVTAKIPNGGLCVGDAAATKAPFLLVIVCSAVSNTDARNAIRDTWMKAKRVQNGTLLSALENITLGVKVAFLLGETTNETIQNDVYLENELHGDIIQEGFYDSYLNLTLKSVMLLKWVTTYCPEVSFVLKTDDDMFVNIPALVGYLSTIHRQNVIVGYLFCHARPVKDLRSKWYSPQFMFDGKEYPDYVSGTGYVMSGKIVPALFENALQVPLFHLEDIFITGMVARKTKIVPENYNLFSYLKQPLDNPCLYRKIITSHGLTPSEMKTVWQRVNNVTLDCSAVKLPKIGDAKMKTCKKAKKVAAKKAAILNVHRG